MKEKINPYEKKQFLLLLLLASSTVAFNNTKESSISIIIITCVMLFLYSGQHHGKIQFKLTKFHTKLLTFAFFCLFSAIWAISYSEPIESGITLIEMFACMSVVFMSFQDSSSVLPMLRAVMWSGPVVAVYSFFFYGYDNFMIMMNGSVRMVSAFANTNSVGMCMAVSLILFAYMIMNYGFKIRYTAVVLPVIVLAVSQSRTALITALFGVVLVILFRYSGNKNFFKTLLKLIFAFGILIVFGFFLSKTAIFGGMMKRMEDLMGLFFGGKTDNSASVRSRYIKAGFQQFLKTPILGLGIRNTYVVTRAVTGHITYLHNNFVELLAGGGIVGFWIYYSFYFYAIKKLIVPARKKIANADACLILLLMQLLADYGTVSFYVKNTYIIFTICYLQIYILGKMPKDPDFDYSGKRL